MFAFAGSNPKGIISDLQETRVLEVLAAIQNSAQRGLVWAN